MIIVIDGIGEVEVDDAFKNLTKTQQNIFVDQIREQVRAGAKNKQDADKPVEKQRGRAFAQGVFLGFADELEAAIKTTDGNLKEMERTLASIENAGYYKGQASDAAGLRDRISEAVDQLDRMKARKDVLSKTFTIAGIKYDANMVPIDAPETVSQRLEREAFAKCPNVAIDVAVMEKTELGSVLPLDAGWSDVGSWSALWETSEHKDSQGNVLQGHVISEDSRDCYLRSEHRLVVGLGVKNLVVVETDDAVLIADRSKAQDIKKVVKQLEAAGSPEGKAHRKIYRPWGHYTSVVDDSRWQVKRISVKPGASLSLQMHHHRAEHWIVVHGTAIVERDGEEQLLGENQSTYIPLGCKHRLSNPGKIPVELIEVQSGEYLGEDDIVRFQDRYGRSDLNISAS